MKNNRIWTEYPNMSEDNTDYFEMLVARANIYKKQNKVEFKGVLTIFVGVLILALPNFITNDFLSFIRSIVLFIIAVFVVALHFYLSDRNKYMKDYINKPDYDGLLKMLSSTKMNKVYVNFTNSVFFGGILYSTYLMWNTPFLLFVNYIASMITIYSGICVYLIMSTQKANNRKLVEQILREKEMTMKNLYDEVENWIMTEGIS